MSENSSKPLKDQVQRPVQQEPPDSLKHYYRQLGASEPLSAEDERELWHEIETYSIQIREELYQFAFVLREHLRILDKTLPGNLSENFFVSSFPASGNEHDMGRGTFDLSPWRAAVEGVFGELTQEFETGKTAGKLQRLRRKSIKLLSEHPVNRVKLYEWYDAARFYQRQYGENPEYAGTLESKMAMRVEDFLCVMSRLDSLFAELDSSRQRMVTCNLRLVISLAQPYRNTAVPMSDLIQEGNMGLIRAIDRFDQKLGHKFSTYATWWVRQSIARAVANQSRVIRIPSHMIATIVRINRAEQDFIQRTGRSPEDAELAAILELPRERISAIKKMSSQTISLQAPVSDTGEKSLLENLLAEGDEYDPLRRLTADLLQKRLHSALDHLSEREQQIIRMRYGIGMEEKTLLEISQIFQVTRERIRQIELRAIQKLRNPDLEVSYQDYSLDH